MVIMMLSSSRDSTNYVVISGSHCWNFEQSIRLMDNGTIEPSTMLDASFD